MSTDGTTMEEEVIETLITMYGQNQLYQKYVIAQCVVFTRTT